jgi:clan AA aspartic protease (TIGR02281 family)
MRALVAAVLTAVLIWTGPGPVHAESIPLTRDNGTFVVRAVVNDQITLNFTLDSGASDVSIPADVFSTLVRTGTIRKDDYLDTQVYELADGSKSRSQRVRLRSLKVGSVELRNVVASVAPQSGTLLLGQSFLSRLQSWSIDNQRHLLVMNESPARGSDETPTASQPAPQTAPATSQGDPFHTAMECADAEAKSPETTRLYSLGIIGGHPTFPQISNNAYATPEDSGMAMMFVRRMNTCWAPLSLPPDPMTQHIDKLLTGFANGIFTYGDTALLMRSLIQKESARAGAPALE